MQKIEKITESFKVYDQDNDGVITTAQFREMVSVTEEFEDNLLKGKRVLYSDVVDNLTKRKKKTKKYQS